MLYCLKVKWTKNENAFGRMYNFLKLNNWDKYQNIIFCFFWSCVSSMQGDCDFCRYGKQSHIHANCKLLLSRPCQVVHLNAVSTMISKHVLETIENCIRDKHVSVLIRDIFQIWLQLKKETSLVLVSFSSRSASVQSLRQVALTCWDQRNHCFNKGKKLIFPSAWKQILLPVDL